jgi:hypothetical protein
MSLVREPGDWRDSDRDRAARSGEQRKAIREQRRRIGRGSFACPSCDLPLMPFARIAVSARLECPFCGEVRVARHFVRLDAVDTTRNEVVLTARLPER